MAMQLNMSISFVVLQCPSAIWLIKEFHPQRIILLPCVNRLKHFSLQSIILNHIFQPYYCLPSQFIVKFLKPLPSTQVTTVKLPVSTKKQSVNPIHRDVPHVAPPSTRVTSVKCTKKQTTGTKRKQVSLDVLLPKKRACETQSSIASQSDRPSTSQTFSSVTPTTKKSDTKMQQIPKEKPASTDSWPFVQLHLRCESLLRIVLCNILLIHRTV